MSNSHLFSLGPITHRNQRESRSTRTSQYRVGLLLTLVGNMLVMVAFFSPWFDVFKLNDPSFVFPKRGYSPWMVLASGRPGSLSVVTTVFLLLILGMALSSLVLALTRATRRRLQTVVFARTLAVLSLVMMIMSVPMIPYALSFSWPFLSATPSYGLVLAVAGFVSVLVGLATLSAIGARRQ
jgi:hypothetical protein